MSTLSAPQHLTAPLLDRYITQYRRQGAVIRRWWAQGAPLHDANRMIYWLRKHGEKRGTLTKRARMARTQTGITKRDKTPRAVATILPETPPLIPETLRNFTGPNRIGRGRDLNSRGALALLLCVLRGKSWAEAVVMADLRPSFNRAAA